MAERAVSSPYPYITITVRILGGGPEIETVALLDTGFEGYLLLPSIRLATGIQAFCQRLLQTADGRINRLPLYRAELEIAGLSGVLSCPTFIGGREVLLGRAVLDHFRVTFDHGREVIVEP